MQVLPDIVVMAPLGIGAMMARVRLTLKEEVANERIHTKEG
jgi:hypothetical protein